VGRTGLEWVRRAVLPEPAGQMRDVSPNYFPGSMRLRRFRCLLEVLDKNLSIHRASPGRMLSVGSITR